MTDKERSTRRRERWARVESATSSPSARSPNARAVMRIRCAESDGADCAPAAAAPAAHMSAANRALIYTLSGTSRKRLPVASKVAFAIAAGIGDVAASPAPTDGSSG